jgi:hypothetical protein
MFTTETQRHGEKRNSKPESTEVAEVTEARVFGLTV